eukprot:2207783-Pleurochrysis_carterae.AAC.2
MGTHAGVNAQCTRTETLGWTRCVGGGAGTRWLEDSSARETQRRPDRLEAPDAQFGVHTEGERRRGGRGRGGDEGTSEPAKCVGAGRGGGCGWFRADADVRRREPRVRGSAHTRAIRRVSGVAPGPPARSPLAPRTSEPIGGGRRAPSAPAPSLTLLGDGRQASQPHYFVLNDGSVLEVAPTFAPSSVPFDRGNESSGVPRCPARIPKRCRDTGKKPRSHAFCLILFASNESLEAIRKKVLRRRRICLGVWVARGTEFSSLLPWQPLIPLRTPLWAS